MVRADAYVRYALAVVFFLASIASLFGFVPVWAGVVAFALGIVMVLTGVARFCPLYALARINHKTSEDAKSH